MSDYKGLWLYADKKSVQVKDPHGNEISLAVDEYTRRGILPPLNEFKYTVGLKSDGRLYPPASGVPRVS